MFVSLEITKFTYFRLKFESETENMFKFYSFSLTKEEIGMDAFCSAP